MDIIGRGVTTKRGGGGQVKEGVLAQNVSDPRFSHFVAPLPPVINDRSLTVIMVSVMVMSIISVICNIILLGG